MDICHRLELDWEETADLEDGDAADIRQRANRQLQPERLASSPVRLSRVRLIVVIDDANLDGVSEIDRERWQSALRRASGDAELTIQSIEVGSIVLVLEGSQEGCERIEALFKSGQLGDLLGVEVLDVRLEPAIAAPVNLSQWLQNSFAEAIEAGWQNLEEIFGSGTAIPAFRAQAVKRAKQIQLGDSPTETPKRDRSINLIIDIAPAQNEEISLFLAVYPVAPQTALPENLQITVFSQTGEVLAAISAADFPNRVAQEFLFEPGEQFWVEISLGELSHREDFIL